MTASKSTESLGAQLAALRKSRVRSVCIMTWFIFTILTVIGIERLVRGDVGKTLLAIASSTLSWAIACGAWWTIETRDGREKAVLRAVVAETTLFFPISALIFMLWAVVTHAGLALSIHRSFVWIAAMLVWLLLMCGFNWAEEKMKKIHDTEFLSR